MDTSAAVPQMPQAQTDSEDTGRAVKLDIVAAKLAELNELAPERAQRFVTSATLTPQMRSQISHEFRCPRTKANYSEYDAHIRASYGTQSTARHGYGDFASQQAVDSVNRAKLSDRGKQEVLRSLPLGHSRKMQMVADARTTALKQGIATGYDFGSNYSEKAETGLR